jgi:hypothetical protein
MQGQTVGQAGQEADESVDLMVDGRVLLVRTDHVLGDRQVEVYPRTELSRPTAECETIPSYGLAT